MFDTQQFDRDFAQGQRRFNFMFRLVSTIIGIGFIAVFVFYILVGVVLWKSADGIQENGLQGVIAQIWCGSKNKDCLK